jgi:hypothetical protein
MKWMRSYVILMVGFFGVVAPAGAQFELGLLRKVAVFPIAGIQHENADEAWWQMRETLTKEQFFLVASRRFMINRGVFQPRTELKPADAIILAKLLDAEFLITAAVIDREMKVWAYHGENGFLLGSASLEFHPAIPVKDQLVGAATRLAMDLISQFPYQSFVVKDEVIGRVLYEVGDKKVVQIFPNLAARLKEGDPVQWVRVSGETSRPFFTEGSFTQVLAEGKVLSVSPQKIEVEILRLRNERDFQEGLLVRLPNEAQRLKEQFSSREQPTGIGVEYLSEEMRTPKEQDGGHNKTSAALTWILSLALMVLLAF